MTNECLFRRQVPFEEADLFAKANDMLFIETSAKTATNVMEAFIRASETIHDKIQRGLIDITTDVRDSQQTYSNNRFPILLSRQELKSVLNFRLGTMWLFLLPLQNQKAAAARCNFMFDEQIDVIELHFSLKDMTKLFSTIIYKNLFPQSFCHFCRLKSYIYGIFLIGFYIFDVILARSIIRRHEAMKYYLPE